MIVLLVEHFFTEEGKARFPAWVREIGAVASGFPGFIDIRQMTRLDAPDRSFFMLSFDMPEHVRGFDDVKERQHAEMQQKQAELLSTFRLQAS